MKLTRINDFSYMVEKEGKMNVPAVIFASDTLMEKIKLDNTLRQAMNVACLPGIQKHSLTMPDAHEGYGFPIGGVAAFDEKEGGIISPGGIGYDINCGVRLVSTNMTRESAKSKISDLLNLVQKNVPAGVGSSGKIRATREELNDVLFKGARWAIEHGYGWKEDLERHEENGEMKVSEHYITADAIKRGMPQLGSLGSGNHFLELQYVEEIYNEKAAKAFGVSKNQLCVMIHCGSRGLGHQICSDYLREMEKSFGQDISKLPDRELIYAPLDSELGKKYYNAMSAAANFAWANRQMIMHWVRESFAGILKSTPEDLEMKLVYDVAHNIAKFEEHEIDGKKKTLCIHRKGATRSFGPGRIEIPAIYRKIGQPVIIPGSMGTSSYLLSGTTQAEHVTFGSTAHGAGRVMSRGDALRRFRGEDVRDNLLKQNIQLRASGGWKGIAEEAPEVYKDIDEVVRVSNVAGIGTLVAKLKPMGVIKG
ncbi:MAG: RtcB family protein [Nanoarchaeota archaeon]|nr:RtcB family protein [Nanoarchaeota archaeon]MBU4299806.1 RtcB family protein [Nanoarchaeota archaeon]MBU4452212.1 RtcB family protein [Nanoarchaeota archaeon]MCG2723598.1 RtcB family protein [archaeon]